MPTISFCEGIPVPMTPDGEVVWNAQTVSGLDGVLYVAPDADPSTVDYMLQLADREERNWVSAEFVDFGRYGTVNRIGNVAFKRSHYNYEADPCLSPAQEQDAIIGLSALRASVMLQVGLDKIAAEPGGPTYAAPVQYACFVANDLTGERVATTWAMSYEKGHSPRWPRLGLPHTEKRQERYRQAIEACGGDSDSVHYDDRTDNILVRRNLSGGISRIVKLDVSARYAYKW